MKKRIGTKYYDTDNGILLIPEKNLYKQPMKKSFYLFDGETITPLTYDEAAEMIYATENPELISILAHKADHKGITSLRIKAESIDKLAEYSRKTGKSMKSIIEDYIDSLSIE